jgi:hypothetical protein
MFFILYCCAVYANCIRYRVDDSMHLYDDVIHVRTWSLPILQTHTHPTAIDTQLARPRRKSATSRSEAEITGAEQIDVGSLAAPKSRRCARTSTEHVNQVLDNHGATTCRLQIAHHMPISLCTA